MILEPGLHVDILVESFIPGYHILFANISKIVKTVAPSESPDTAKPYVCFTPMKSTFPELLSPTSEPLSKIFYKTEIMLSSLDTLTSPSMLKAIATESTFATIFSDLFEDICAALVNTLIIPLHECPALEDGDRKALVDVKILATRNGLRAIVGLLKLGTFGTDGRMCAGIFGEGVNL